MVKVVTYVLENNATVQGLLGEKSHGENHKVYPVIVENSEKAPFISVRLTDSSRLGKDVSCGTDNTVLVSCWCESYDDLDALADAVIDALEGQSGSINGVNVGSIFYENQADLDYSKDYKVYGRGLTFKVQ